MYQIPECNLDRLIAKLEKLQAKAQKLGCGSIVWAVGEPEFIETKITTGDGYKTSGGMAKVYPVQVVGQEPVIDGWQFVAKVEHLETGNVINSLSEKNLPSRFRDSSYELCEHCHTKRQRNFTYVVTDGSVFKQVGSTCLKDFLGHGDPLAWAELAEIIANIERTVSEFYFEEGTTTSDYVDLAKYMSYVAMAVREHGFVSRSKAAFDELPSADRAFSAMYPGKYTEKVYPSEQDCKLASATIEYIRNIEESTEYIHNLSVIFSQDYISIRRHLGYAASAIVTYQRYLEEKARIDDSKSEFQGVIKKRQVWNLTVTKVVGFDGYYGPSWLHVMQDESGNVFVWTSSSYQYEIGDAVQGKGTVKEHKEYRGIKQTVLTRCKFAVIE